MEDKETSAYLCKRNNTYTNINMAKDVDCGSTALRQRCQLLSQVGEQ